LVCLSLYLALMEATFKWNFVYWWCKLDKLDD